MDNRAALTAADVPLILDGKELHFSPFTDKDIAELDLWVRAEFIKTARASLEPAMSQLEREETLTVAMRAASGLSWMSGQGAQMMGTVTGMARLAYQGVKRNHPEITCEWLQKQLFDIKNVDAVRAAFEAANHLPEDEPSDSKKPKKKKNRRIQERRFTGHSRRGTGGRRRK